MGNNKMCRKDKDKLGRAIVVTSALSWETMGVISKDVQGWILQAEGTVQRSWDRLVIDTVRRPGWGRMREATGWGPSSDPGPSGTFVVFVTWFIYSPEWPQTHSSPLDSAYWVSGLQAWATTTVLVTLLRASFPSEWAESHSESQLKVLTLEVTQSMLYIAQGPCDFWIMSKI